MKPSLKSVVSAFSLVILLLSAGMAHGGMIGNSFQGVLYDVNPVTGAATNPRATGINNLLDVAHASDGTLYGVNTFSCNQAPRCNSLYKFNPITGAPTLVGATGFSQIFEGDLAFQPGTGVLFGVEDVRDSNHRLFTLNTSTGRATIVGNITGSPKDLSGMAFAADGRLYIVDDVSNSLLNVDPGTATVLSSVPLSVQLGVVVGFEFDPTTGVPYVVDGMNSGTNSPSLYTLNVSTGALTLIGSTGVSLAGLSFSPVPEPASGFLVLSGLAVLHLRRRSHVTGSAERAISDSTRKDRVDASSK